MHANSTICKERNNGLKSGFSLMELMIVIGIIALLAGLSMPAIMLVKRLAKRQITRDRVKQIVSAWDVHLQKNRKFVVADPAGVTCMDPDTIKALNTSKKPGYPETKAILIETGKLEFLDKGSSTEGTGFLDAWGDDYLRINEIDSITALIDSDDTEHRKWQIRITLDADGDGVITAPDETEVNRKVIAWSVGPDGIDQTGDEINSWE